MLPCLFKNRLFVNDAYIDIFIRIFMSDVIWEVIACYNVISKLVRGVNYWQKISQAAQKHQFLLSHIQCFITSIVLSTSSSVSRWCMGRQMTCSAILCATGRFSGLAESSPRYVENVLIKG